jgi:hypothetical protein
MTNEINNMQDIIDSRDIIERIADLSALALVNGGDGLDRDEADELVALIALASEGRGYAPDWEYGVALIRGSHFEKYAEQLADDLGLINPAATWPNSCIDWEQAARELQYDYTALDFDGVTYWVR